MELNNAIMLSIRPDWAEKILSGEKTVEVRKTFPGFTSLPFKVYLYETVKNRYDAKGRGAVVGEFLCDEIYDIEWNGKGYDRPYDPKLDCLSLLQLHDYIGKRSGYGWHVTNVRTYSELIPVTSFIRVLSTGYYSGDGYHLDKRPYTRPPQSWSYCIEL